MLLIFITSFNFLFSQNNTEENTTIATTKLQLQQNFMAALETQDQQTIIMALESGDAKAKAACFEILAKKGISDQELVNLLNTYITYGYYDESLTYENMSSSWLVRNEAIKAVGALKSQSSVIYLASVLLQEKNQVVIISAIKSMGEIADPKSTAPLLTYLLVADKPTIINEIVISLGKIGNTEALPSLINIIQNDEYSMTIKNNAVESIKQLRQTTQSDNGGNTTDNDTTTN